MADVDPETRAIDEQMDEPVWGKPVEADVAELLQAPGKGGVIGDREIDVEDLCQGTQKALGLSESRA